MNKSVFAKNLRKFLKDKNMSQVDLAKKTGCTEAAISRYVNGSRYPNFEKLYMLAKALDKRTEDFYDNETV